MQFDEDGKLVKLEGYELASILQNKENNNGFINIIEKNFIRKSFNKAYNEKENKYPDKHYNIIIDVINYNSITRRYKFYYIFETYFNEWIPSDLYEDDIEEITEI